MNAIKYRKLGIKGHINVAVSVDIRSNSTNVWTLTSVVSTCAQLMLWIAQICPDHTVVSALLATSIKATVTTVTAVAVSTSTSVKIKLIIARPLNQVGSKQYFPEIPWKVWSIKPKHRKEAVRIMQGVMIVSVQKGSKLKRLALSCIATI